MKNNHGWVDKNGVFYKTDIYHSEIAIDLIKINKLMDLFIYWHS